MLPNQRQERRSTRLGNTDIHTTWKESREVLGRGEETVQRALNEIARTLQFVLLGVEFDNVLTAEC